MIVLTTPTGTIGAAVAESHADPAVLDAALIGADALFVLVPPSFGAPHVTDHYLGFARPIAEAVRAHRVRRVVAVSSLGRGFVGPAGLLSAAWAMDEVLESSGVAYRSLQPPFFMENLLHQVELIRDRGIFVLAADPDVPYPAVATDDVARTAAGLLSHRATFGDYRAQLESAGASTAMAQGMVEMAQAQAAGVYPPSTPDGAGTTFRDWCELVLAPALARVEG